MSERTWYTIYYSFNNYRDVLPCKGGLNVAIRRAVDPLFLGTEGVGRTDALRSFFEERGVEFPLPRLLLDWLLDLDFPLMLVSSGLEHS